ncbi:MAG TPA: M1 family aminopeptidase [Kofleriaceae bacterium]|nr:M1 family aminopeptidase [Kofleriaceae bacterium]
MKPGGTLRHVAGFEWRYQVRSPVFWVGSLLFFLFTFAAVTIDQIQIGSRGNVHVNAPIAMLEITGVMSIFAIFVIVSMVANVVLRDDETGFAPIVRSTSVSKLAYLVGRFTGATAAALCVLATIPLGIFLGTLMPWLDPEKVGPFALAHYAYVLFAFALPTVLIISAGYFAVATATRSMMATYIAVIVTLVLYLAFRVLLRDPQFDTVVGLSDPFALSTLRIATKYWTAAERNTLLPPLDGLLLANRALWSAIALGVFGVAYRRFRFEATSEVATGFFARRRARREAKHAAAARPVPRLTSAPSPLAAPRHDAATRFAQLLQLARFDVGSVVRSPAFAIVLVLGVLNVGISMWLGNPWYGVGPYPVTRQMVIALQGAFAFFPWILAVFYASELVWRDRDRRMHEIVDATAAPDWVHLVPKVLAIVVVLGAANLVGVITGLAVQTLKGYFQYELGHYLVWFAVPATIFAVQLAVLSVFVQVLSPSKYIGWAIMLGFIVAQFALGAAGFEHNLYNFGSTSPVPLSDMNGMGRFWIGQAWFNVYWSAFALVLLVLAYALWRRGATTALRPRLHRLGSRLHGGALAALVLGGLGVIGSGIYIYDNTNLRNRYQPAPARDALRADYEKHFLQYQWLPQPRITSVTLDVQLYPKDTRAVTKGSYQIENRSGAPIDALHLTWDDKLVIDRVELAGATLDRAWPELSYRIYKLSPPLQPGETRTLTFATTLTEVGFPNNAPLTRLVENGTFLNNGEIAPQIGVSRFNMLRDRAKRRKYGLPPDLRPPTLEDERGRTRSPLSGTSDWVSADITITTDADQTPIAPGYTVSDTVTGTRRTAEFRTDAPINLFFSIQSARYAERHEVWNGVNLAVYFHPDHAYNVDRMMRAMKASLALFSVQFTPYQFRQARILEFPAYADFAQSFSNTIPYSENIGFITDVSDPNDIDVVSYVTAHEIGHQWWGHQLLPGDQQGATMLIESLAQYSAMLVMEQMYGKEQMQKFLKYELDRYLRSRGGEVVEELPLARVEDQPYIHYQKGALVFYWLKEVIGEPTLNRALTKLLQQYAFKTAPLPNTLDFLRILRAEAGPQYDGLITDLFEKITLLDLKASRATALARADGKYEVTLEVKTRKLYADAHGVETESPLDEPLDVGVFTAPPGSPGFTAASVLAMHTVEVKSGTQIVKLVVDQRPAFAGIDPYNKRIDRNSDDNLIPVELAAAK